jgi:hypothetical protein
MMMTSYIGSTPFWNCPNLPTASKRTHVPAHIIHERFYCNRRYEAGNHLEVSYSRAKTSGMALDLASAVATHLAARFSQPSGQARRSATGTGAHPGAPGLAGCDRGHTVSSVLSFLAAPRARLVWRLGGFITNRHE